MIATVNLYSNKKGELNKFLSHFYNTNLDINNHLKWEKKYENQVDIDLNEWISLKAVIEDEKAIFYLNDDLQPSLVVDQMIHDKSMRGNIGFFVDIGTEAFFKDLKITYFD